MYLFNKKKNCAANSNIESLYKYQHNIKMGWYPFTLYCNLISYGHQGEMSGVESYLMPVNRL